MWCCGLSSPVPAGESTGKSVTELSSTFLILGVVYLPQISIVKDKKHMILQVRPI
jgi:hypothetical protein